VSSIERIQNLMTEAMGPTRLPVRKPATLPGNLHYEGNPQFFHGVVKNDGTPLGGRWKAGMKCMVQMGGHYPVTVWCDFDQDHITVQQLRDHVTVGGRLDPQVALASKAKLMDKFMKSPTAILVPLFPVIPRDPKGFPTEISGIPIVVADNAPYVHPTHTDYWWWGDWFVFPNGARKIYVQTQIAYAIMSLKPGRRDYWIKDTTEHERDEMDASVREVRLTLRNIRPSQVGGFAQQVSGIVHSRMPDVKRAGTEAAYNKEFEAGLRELGVLDHKLAG